MKKQSPSPFPRSLTWLVSELSLAYHDKRIVLALIGDFARMVRKRRKEKRGLSNTTCIACGGWISVERENRGQHTCSERCQRWYRALMRAKLAAKYCRYCHRPEGHPEAIKRRRPGRLRVMPRTVKAEVSASRGSASHRMLKVVPPGLSILLRPDKPRGVELGDLETAVEQA